MVETEIGNTLRATREESDVVGHTENEFRLTWLLPLPSVEAASAARNPRWLVGALAQPTVALTPLIVFGTLRFPSACGRSQTSFLTPEVL